MANVRTVLCEIAPMNFNQAHNRQAAGTGEIAVLKIHSAHGASSRTNVILNKAQRFTLSFGDRIECVSGVVTLTFHPNHPNLAHTVAIGFKGHLRKELEVTEEAISPRQLSAPDISIRHYTQGGKVYTPGRTGLYRRF